jgi:saccharopine dehydrogenase-like protein
MTDLITPTGRVHWLGTGLSTGSGLGLACQGTDLVLWGRSVDKAVACLDRLGLRGQAQPRAFGPEALAAEIAPGDVVVSMLPASQHAALVKLAGERGAHFACSSYLSPQIAAFAGAAERAGLVILTEAGLDPGIDHLLAHELVREAVATTGDQPAVARFTSYCGSNPAVPGEFRYRFSWAPRGVLTALLTPARFIDGKAEQSVRYPWESVRKLSLGGERYEVYPNRDSLPFLQTYQFPPAWTVETFIRGTLRWDGWSDAWREVFAELPHADDDRITSLAAELAERYPTTPQDRDRVVMSVALEVRADSGSVWHGEYVLDATGAQTESATPRLVSTALAGGILELTGAGMAPGLHQATADPALAGRWLAFLAGHGITARFRLAPEPV